MQNGPSLRGGTASLRPDCPNSRGFESAWSSRRHRERMSGSLWKKFWESTHHAAHWLVQEGAETLHSATHWLEDRSFSCIKCRTKVRGSTIHCPTCGARFVPEEVEVQTKRRLTGLLGNISKQSPV